VCIDKWNALKEALSHPIDAIVNFIKGGDSDAASAAGQSARGGIFSHPYLTWVAEAGYPEVIVPITHDANAYGLWAKAGQMLGINPSMPTVSRFHRLRCPVALLTSILRPLLMYKAPMLSRMYLKCLNRKCGNLIA
jgi:hypothetical protein